MTARRSWVPGADGSGFPAEHLPYGVFSTGDRPARVGARIGDHVVDLARLAADDPGGVGAVGDLFARPSLNAFMAAGPDAWRHVRPG